MEGEEFADALGHFDGTRTNENRLLAAVNLENFQCDATELGFFCFVDDIREIQTNHRLVCWNLDNIEGINLTELILFCLRGTGHTGKLCEEAEVVLDGDGRHRLLLVLDLDTFFGFYSLVKTI